MITLEEYDRVQKLLKKRGNPRPQVKNLPYRGFIRCGECGCMITCDTKTKFIKSTNKERFYTYYACTRKRMDYACSQKKVMRKEDLELIIEKELEKITILPEFRDKALEILNRENDTEIAERSSIYKCSTKPKKKYKPS